MCYSFETMFKQFSLTSIEFRKHVYDIAELLKKDEPLTRCGNRNRALKLIQDQIENKYKVHVSTKKLDKWIKIIEK